VTLRLRLTILYTLLFGACGALLLGLSSWLVHRQVNRTLPPGFGDRALAQLDAQYVLALGGMLLVAAALGYLVADRALAPLRRVTGLARRVTQERLDERIALEGPRDELRDMADTLDGMLDRLAAAFDGQRRFVANASHELRTPLTVIRAEVEVALADPDASAVELRQMGEVVLEAADRTQALLDSLMVLARSQQALPRREPVDLAHAARTAAAVCEPEARVHGLDVRLDLQPAPLEGDPPLVERLVGNLVENAVRHNEPGGSVRVTTRPGLVRVENTGRAIADADVRRLAEPFERLGRDSDGPGAGLGLSIVRAVADAHGARLSLHPRAGGGLEAEVTFAHSSPSGSSPARMRSTWVGVKGGEASASSSWYARNR
jgi:signal transduction histidine kinase